MDKNLFLSQLSQGKAQLEANSAFFVKKVDPKRLSKGKKLQHYYKGVKADRQGNAVLEWSIPSQSDPSKSYTCFIDIIPKDTTLFNIAKAKAKLADAHAYSARRNENYLVSCIFKVAEHTAELFYHSYILRTRRMGEC